MSDKDAKKIAAISATIFVNTIFFYVLFSAINWEMNPKKWETWARVSAIILIWFTAGKYISKRLKEIDNEHPNT